MAIGHLRPAGIGDFYNVKCHFLKFDFEIKELMPLQLEILLCKLFKGQ